MRRTSVFFALALGVVRMADAQCTPNPLYQDSVFGVWPDTTTNFAPGMVGVFYSDTLNLIVPANASAIGTGFPPLPIDSVQLTSVSGLPPGLSVACNSQTAAPCTFLPTVLGCGLIEGTPTVAGNYPLTINVVAWLYFLGPISYPYSFTGYDINIATGTGVADITSRAFGAINTPNPFNGRTNFEVTLPVAGEATISVFDLLGGEIWRQKFEGHPGVNRVPFDGGLLPEGIYIYRVKAGTEAFTGRMVLHR